MKKLFSLIFFVAIFEYAAGVSKAHYLQVIYPSNVTIQHAIPILFKGNELVSEQNTLLSQRSLFEIYEEKLVSDIYFLITTNLSRPKSLEIMYWQTSEQHPYRLFHAFVRPYTGTLVMVGEQDVTTTGTQLVPIKNVSDSLYEWVVEELDNSKPIIDVPDMTITILSEPQWITIKPVLFDNQHPFRLLPSIVFNENVDPLLFAQKINEMVCVLPDFRPWNKKTSRGICALANSQTVVRLPVPSKFHRV